MGLWLPVGVFFILLLVAAGLLLPVRVKVRAAGGLKELSVNVWVKPPLWPWYLRTSVRIPKVKKQSGKEAGGGASTAAPREDAVPKERPERAAGRDERSLSESLRRARDGIASFKNAYPDVKEALSLAMEAATFESVKLTGKVGTGEASDTAILCGTINMLAGVFVSVAQRKGTRFRRKPLIRVDPVFSGVHLSFLAEVETSFTLARVLYVSGKMTRYLKTARAGEKRERAIFSRESGILN